jgi:kynurenine formamidase
MQVARVDAAREVEMKIVDLSYTIETLPEDVPSFLRVEVGYADHADGAVEMERAFGVAPRLMRNGEGPAGEQLSICTHAGTHVDAPWHHNSTIQGAPAATIDELALDWFFAPGVVVDARGKADGDPVTVAEMEQGIAAASHELRPGDIVLVPHRRRRLLSPARLHAPRLRRHRRGDPMAI